MLFSSYHILLQQQLNFKGWEKQSLHFIKLVNYFRRDGVTEKNIVVKGAQEVTTLYDGAFHIPLIQSLINMIFQFNQIQTVRDTLYIFKNNTMTTFYYEQLCSFWAA